MNEQYRERTFSRSLIYSLFHRPDSARHLYDPSVKEDKEIIDRLDELGCIDIDAEVFVEMQHKGKWPVAIIEAAKFTGEYFKKSLGTKNLAKISGIPAYNVLYVVSEKPNPAYENYQWIKGFWVKRDWPPHYGRPETNGYYPYPPRKYINFLFNLRKNGLEGFEMLKKSEFRLLCKMLDLTDDMVTKLNTIHEKTREPISVTLLKALKFYLDSNPDLFS